ncbi:MAG: DNA methyltransferase [Verrucomicrobiota bacterium]
MPLSWNEIRHRAIAFANEWQGETREAAERQTFWNEFFHVFGIRRRTVATFEEPVKKLSGDWGFIDLFWPGKLLVEHKTAGADLGKAHAQGMDYIRGLKNSGRDAEIPRWLLVSDFTRVALHDLEPEQDPDAPLLQRLPPSIEFPLAEFHKHIRHFAFVAGYTQHRLDPESPANLEATQLMCNLHDALEHGGYTGHELKRFLVRILFCLFAEDTGLFPTKGFELLIRDRTAEDGSDLGLRLAHLFRILNTDTTQRQKNLDEDLSQFPYVNGELFSEKLEFADFNADMRNGLLACCRFHWETISPAVFGSLFQAVMDSKERRQVGAHYTAEKNILKLIRSLFLDELRAEFESIKTNRSTRRTARLEEFHEKLAKLTFFDPACGCGNFLVITYRELRKLELEVLLELHGRQHEMALDYVNKLSKLNVHQFYGIEIEEFPARIAEVALWLTDHQANIALSQAFSQLVLRLPLHSSPHIMVANALRTEWRTVLPPKQCSFILGNPPFVGSKYQTAEQRADMDIVAEGVENAGLLDLVTGWYFKAAEYMRDTQIITALVSTNSITQGEQAGVLWHALFQHFGVKIHFVHRTFPWESEARGKAHVHVVILGFGAGNAPVKRIYDYESDPEHPTISTAGNISPYLVEGADRVIISRTTPICPVPPMGIGNKPIDGGNYLFTPEEKAAFIKMEPAAEPLFRRWIGSEEFINGIERWCLWLGECPPAQLRSMPLALARVEAVRKFRLASKSAPTKKLAATPTRFHVENFPERAYLVVPKVSSERRPYIPIGFIKPDILSSDLLQVIPEATPYHFGVLSSVMHMAWVRLVAGRLKSDYRYSNRLVYNNYPWPETPTDTQRNTVITCARRVLELRVEYGDGRHGFLPTRKTGIVPASLADLYDPLAMPAPLLKAHQELDRAVDRCYRKKPFVSDRQRVEFLFQLYEQITAPLAPTAKPKHTARRKKKAADVPPVPPLLAQQVPNADQAAADAAHAYFLHEEPPPYRTNT